MNDFGPCAFAAACMLKDNENENGAALDMLYLADQASKNSNSSTGRLNISPVQAELQSPNLSSKSKGPKLNAGRWPFCGMQTETVAAGLDKSAADSPSLWGFLPTVPLPNQPNPVPLPTQIGQVYPCSGGYLPLLPVSPLLQAGGRTTVGKGCMWGSTSAASWPGLGYMAGRLCGLDDATSVEQGVRNEAVHVAKLSRTEITSNGSSEALSSDGCWGREQVGIHPCSDGRLRWLAKRKRTGPKPGG